MNQKISTREDIKLIISKFYEKLLEDTKMMPFFNEIVCSNQLEHHLEIITDFWNDILFHTTTYKNNTLQKHLNIDAFVKFEQDHFTIWLSYFNQTLDELFNGEKVDIMKNRAKSIAMVMQLKMNLYKNTDK